MAPSSRAVLVRIIAPALAFLAACGDTEPTASTPDAVRDPSTRASLEIQSLASSPSITIGETIQLVTSVQANNHGHLMPIIWSSSDDGIVRVQQGGLVTGIAEGTATVTAWSGLARESANITVTAAPVGEPTDTIPPTDSAPPADTTGPNDSAIKSVSIAVASGLVVGQTVQAVATAIDSTGHQLADVEFSWSTTSATVASVSPSGLVSGLAAGTTVVSAHAGDQTATATVVVTTPTVESTPPGDPVGSAAELPRSFVDTRYVEPTGRTITVPPGGDLQDAVNSAQRGDVIVLQAGAAYAGPVMLPAKPGSASDGWITVRTSAPDGVLPPPGTRVTPRHAPVLAQIITPDYRPAIRVASGSSGWRLTGLEVTVNANFTGQQYGLVVLGEGDESSMGQFARDLVLDRSWVHGQSNTELMRCVAMNGIRVAVVDSWLSACHAREGDSQAIAGWNGPGPTKIANNYLEGAGENVIFGGADPGVDGLVPSDIEIVGNHFFKPLSWKGGPWQVKNLLELKNAQRVLVEGNVFQNNWTASQDGWAFIWASLNQGGGYGAWTVVRDVTFRYNRVDNVEGGFNLGERYDASAVSSSRFTIVHNLMTNVGFADSGELDRLFLVSGGLADVTIEHNTGFASRAYLQFGDVEGATKPRLSFRNNLGGDARYTFNSPRGDGAAMFSAYGVPLANVAGNCVVTPDGYYMPAGSIYPATLAEAALVSPTGFTGDYRLASASPCRGRATDSADPGADISTLMSKTARAVVPE